MPTIITKPAEIETTGCERKIIKEYIGLINTNTKHISIAHMYAPAGWTESGQCPEFDEYTLVLEGTLRVEFRDGFVEIRNGQAIIVQKGEWVRYSNPIAEDLRYISVCIPAFSPQRVHRDIS